MAADPARRDPARAPGELGGEVPDDLDADGSPLLVHTRRQADLLRGYLGERLKNAALPADLVAIEVGMRYGNPAIDGAVDRLVAAGCDRILVVPMYPQYAASTTASLCDAVFASVARRRYVPALRTITSYHDDAGYIRALARQIGGYWEKHGRPDRLVMSFHGVPRFTLERGDPYFCLCQKTGRLLAQELGLEAGRWALTFQSRFGKAEWLKPYTAPTLVELAQNGVQKVDVVCPGFVSDCLETLRGDRDRGQGRVRRRRRQGVPLHPLPQRGGRLDARARRPLLAPPARLAPAAARRGGAGRSPGEGESRRRSGLRDRTGAAVFPAGYPEPRGAGRPLKSPGCASMKPVRDPFWLGRLIP